MNNLETSQGALNRAERWYQSAIRGYEDERWDDVIYSLQMSIEQSLKAILILYGIEYPKKHDISKNYKDLKKQDIPSWFRDKTKNHTKILKNLTNKRGISAYGYVDGFSKDDFKDDALHYKDLVKDVVDDCKKLITEFSNKQKENNLKHKS